MKFLGVNFFLKHSVYGRYHAAFTNVIHTAEERFAKDLGRVQQLTS